MQFPNFDNSNMRRIKAEEAKSLPVTKRMVMDAYLKVKRNGGASGVDGIGLKEFGKDLGNRLYVVWNRLASGSYHPPAVREVLIPKGDGRHRKLGIPTVSDRVAQQTIKDYLEPRLEAFFHSSSYGYRPNRSAHMAILWCLFAVRFQDTFAMRVERSIEGMR